MNVSLEVKPVKPIDLLGLACEYGKEQTLYRFDPEHTEWMLSQLTVEHGKKLICVGLYVDNELVGGYLGTVAQQIHTPELVLTDHMTFLKKRYRDHGLATIMQREVLELAEERGATKAIGCIQSLIKGSESLYTNNGYLYTGKTYYRNL